MNSLINFLKKPKFLVKFSEDLDNYIVVNKDKGILYVGPKAQCKLFIEEHS